MRFCGTPLRSEAALENLCIANKFSVPCPVIPVELSVVDDLTAMSTPRLGSECGSSISESSGDGLCPQCLIGLALEAGEKTRIVPPPESELPDLAGRWQMGTPGYVSHLLHRQRKVAAHD